MPHNSTATTPFVNSYKGLENLIKEHTPLVKRIAHHLMGRLPPSIQLDDMVQSGMVGLLEVARNFDANKGASFETFAGIRIRGAMLDEIRRGDWTPRSVHKNSRMIQEAIRQIENSTGKVASDAEVAQALKIPLEEYHRMLEDTNSTRLMGIEDLYENGAELANTAEHSSEPLNNLELQRIKYLISQGLRDLPKREALVLSLYYSEELNLREVGEILGVSESRVSQIHAQAMHRLKARLLLRNAL